MFVRQFVFPSAFRYVCTRVRCTMMVVGTNGFGVWRRRIVASQYDIKATGITRPPSHLWYDTIWLSPVRVAFVVSALDAGYLRLEVVLSMPRHVLHFQYKNARETRNEKRSFHFHSFTVSLFTAVPITLFVL